MKINVLSDIHCRNKSLPPHLNFDDLEKTDVLVIAGDLGTYPNRDKIVKNIEEKWGHGNKFDHLVYCWGNHDYYITDRHWLNHHIMKWKPASILDNKIWEIDNVVFLSTTLWTNIRTLVGTITDGLNDYHLIPNFTVSYNNQLWLDNVKWLEDKRNYYKNVGKKVVIVTHHLPSPQLISPRYVGSPLNGAFATLNEYDERRLLNITPDLWIHGHSHEFLDTTIEGVRHIRNPFGYDWDSIDEYKTTGFKLNTIIEI